MYDFDDNQFIPEALIFGGLKEIKVTDAAGLPEYDDPANAKQDEAQLIWVTGNGSDPKGVYKHDGDSYSEISGGGAPSDADYLTATPDVDLSSETVVDAYPFTDLDLSAEYFQTNGNDPITGAFAMEVQNATQGTVGADTGEVFRIGGANGDFIYSIENGAGRIVRTWNAYYDGTDWRYISGNEGAIYWKTNAFGGYQIFTASSGTADGVISWNQSMAVDNSGNANFANGLQSGSNNVLTTADQTVVASGTATLSSGSAVVSTGVTTTGTHIDVSLDPSGGGANASDVKASARAFWDNSAGEYKVEILEDGTSVGNPDVGYKVIEN